MADETDQVSVTVKVDGKRAFVRAVGEFDMASSRILDEALTNLADAGADHVIIDLAAVPFMDSAGLHPIVHLMRHRPAVTATVVNAQPSVVHLFQLHGVESLMTEVVA